MLQNRHLIQKETQSKAIYVISKHLRHIVFTMKNRKKTHNKRILNMREK